MECISRLSEDGPVQVGALAGKLGVRLPSVSRAVRNLTKLGLVEHKSYGNISLTESGELVARQIFRRKQCLTELLGRILGMPAELAEKEANRLEHFLVDDVLLGLETLVDFAASSEAWIKRLQLRLKQAATAEGDNQEIAIAESRVHPGNAMESTLKSNIITGG